MEKEKSIAAYMRVGNYEQLDNSIKHIIERAKQGEIKTLLVSTVEKLCEDPLQRQVLLKELTDYGVEIITALNEEKSSRRCAIYNRYSTDDPIVLAATREKLVAYCVETLGISDYVLFEEVTTVLGEREVFDGMMAQIGQNKFTDLLVVHIDRLQKYDYARMTECIGDLQNYVMIHTMK